MSGTGLTRTVTISAITGDGSLGISIAAGTASDLAGNLAPAAGPSTTFIVDNTLPTIAIGTPSGTITKGGPITYTVTYADTNFNSSTLAVGNITLNKTGTANGTVGVSGTGLTRTVTISAITGDGSLGISIAAGTASDLAGSLAPAPNASTAFIVDNTAPTILIGSSSASYAAGGPITYTVTYADANFNSSTLAPANITLNKTGTANGTVGVSGTGLTRTVTISGITGDGSLGISIASGTASDLAGNLAPASNPSTTFIVDNTAPTILIGSPSGTITTGGPITYTVTYADADFNSSTLAPANITLNKTGTANGTVGVSGTGLTRTVTISGITGDGSLGISIASGTASDLAGNLAPAPNASTAFIVDNTAPTILIGSPSASYAAGGPITYTVTYADANFNSSTLAVANITLNKTGTANGTVGVSGTGLTRTVTISGITGDGSLGISIAAGTASDLAGNLAPAAGPSTTFVADNTPPTAASFSPLPGSTNIPANTTLVVNFSENVAKGGSGNIVVKKTADNSVAASIPITSSQVTVSNAQATIVTGVILAPATGYYVLIDAGAFQDLAGNAFSAITSTSAWSFTVTTALPTSTISFPTAAYYNAAGWGAGTIQGSSSETGGPGVSSVQVSIENTTTGKWYDGSGFNASSVQWLATGGTTAAWTYALAASKLTDGSSYTVSSLATDAGGITQAVATSSTFICDTTAPTINVSAPSGTITTGGPITYTVTYADANFNSSTLAPANITLNKTGTANGTVGVSGTGLTRTVTISGITGDGSLGISIASGTASDLAGNLAPAPTPIATFIVDNTAPTILIGSPSASYAAGGPITYTVTYADTNFNSSTLAAANITLNKTGTANGTVAVSGTGLTRTVTISGITGDGSLGISIAASTASDLAGNLAPATGPSTALIVDNTPPTIGSLSVSPNPVTQGNSITLSANDVADTGGAVAKVEFYRERQWQWRDRRRDGRAAGNRHRWERRLDLHNVNKRFPIRQQYVPGTGARQLRFMEQHGRNQPDGREPTTGGNATEYDG